MARVEGVDRLRRKLNEIPSRVKAEVFKTMNAAADDLMRVQRSLVPVEFGGLRDSIRRYQWPEERTRDRGLKVNVIAGGLPSTIERTERGRVFDRAVLIEFGTKPHKIGGLYRGSHHPGTPPRPFFFPPYRAFKKRIKSQISRSITKACKQAAAK